MVDNVIILAGGSGTRLWPVSSGAYPKQYIKVSYDGMQRSLLHMTLTRAAAAAKKRIMVITLKSQALLVEKELEEWREAAGPSSLELYVLPEPAARNTAPAITAGISCISIAGGDEETNLILPADHLISPLDAFLADTAKAAELARDGYIVTYGITPDRPETGYGYIKCSSQLGDGYTVDQFCEKPDEETAKQFLDEGIYYWNSGMFLFKTDTFLTELSEHAHDVYEAFNPILKATPQSVSARKGNIVRLLDSQFAADVYAGAPSISVDYAVMEKTGRAAMMPSTYTWNDIGSWDEFARLFPRSEGETYEADASDNYVYSDIPVALVGVEGLIVTIKDGKALVCRKGHSQKVKNIVEQMKKQERRDLL